MVECVMTLFVGLGLLNNVPGNREKVYKVPTVPELAVRVKVLPGQTELEGAPGLLLVVRENDKELPMFRPLMTTVFAPMHPKLSTITV